MRHVYGWLLLTPAAILLVGFTHYPALATFVDSFFSTGTVVRPARFVGLANYAALGDDPIFWQVLRNNVAFAIGTIPTSIAIALLMAVWVNDRLPARALVSIQQILQQRGPQAGREQHLLRGKQPGRVAVV